VTRIAALELGRIVVTAYVILSWLPSKRFTREILLELAVV